MKFDVSSLRKDTDEDDFPYTDRAVTFVHVDSSGTVSADHTKTGKTTILNDWRPGELLIATWTGARRSDAFSVDVEAARKALLEVRKPRGAVERQARRQGLGPRQNQLVKQMHGELDDNGKRKYTVQQLADEFGTNRRTILEAIKAASVNNQT
ncbi:hypothetical protein ACIHCX_03590 [Streptomyces sp. NPDC052043]|uniref:hypothetical protein n=1 Tax=Streptomyces sp. NPDC052043 TaxID=3365684 RepID=UPI0037D4D27B